MPEQSRDDIASVAKKAQKNDVPTEAVTTETHRSEQRISQNENKTCTRRQGRGIIPDGKSVQRRPVIFSVMTRRFTV